MKFHPIAEEYPLMGEADLELLAKDIEANGQQIKVLVYNGMILDGRNRWLACQRLGIDCETREHDGPGDEDSLRALVASLNEHRRHLSPDWLARRRADRVARVAEARREGQSLRSIAEAEGVSKAQVERDIEEAQLSRGGTVEPESGRVSGKDGRSRPAKPKKPKKAPEPIPSEEEQTAAAEAIIGMVASGELPSETVIHLPADLDDEPAPPVLDDWGVPVGPHAAEAFAQRPAFDEALKTLRDCAALLDALARGPAGEHLRVGMQFVRNRKGDGGKWTLPFLENAMKHVKAARPSVSDCPYHYNDEGEHPEQCTLCRGVRWSGTLSEHRVPPTLKAAMLDHHGVGGD